MGRRRRYYGRRRYRTYSDTYYEIDGVHISYDRWLSLVENRLNMTRSHLEDLFWSLDLEHQRDLFIQYKERYGEKKYAYAKGRYKRWKEGLDPIPKPVLMRLLHLVPKYLPYEWRIDKMNLLLQGLEFSSDSISFTIDMKNAKKDLKTVLDYIHSTDNDRLSFEVDSDISTIASWLHDDDMNLIQAIINEHLDKIADLKKNTVLWDFRKFCDVVLNMGERRDQVSCCLKLVGKDISVRVRHPGFFSRLFG